MSILPKMNQTKKEFDAKMTKYFFHFKNNLIYNVVHDEEKQLIWYNITVNTQYFQEQLLPLYSIGINLYQYPLEYALQSIIQPQQLKHTKWTKGARVHSKLQFCKITASHPTFVKTKYQFIENGKYVIWNHSFYLQKGSSMVAKLYGKYRILSDKQLKKTSSKRHENRKRWKRMSGQSIANIDFALPHKVGHNNIKNVFLSDLKINTHKSTKLYSIYCDGFNTLNKTFINHPFHLGTGDHINSGVLRDILCQFAHLIVRNAFNFDYLRNTIISKYGIDFDTNCSVTSICSDIYFKRTLELDIVYKVLLLSVKCLDNVRFPFMIQMKIKIIQHEIEAVNATITTCPIFRQSRL
eukprot:159820_1